MTDVSSGDDDRLRAEAAAWIARMHRADASRARPELDAWLNADARHRVIYDRMAARFGEAAVLQHSGIFGRRSKPKRGTAVRYWIGAGVIATVAASFMLLIWPSLEPSRLDRGGLSATQPPREATVLRFDTALAEIKAVRLADGSFVTIDGSSVLDVAFGRERRELVLRRGRARFEVAHESRPFIVRPGHGTVTARGTIFDVMLAKSGEVRVRLLRGAVDVTSSGTETIRMAAGQQVAVLTRGIVPIGSIGTDRLSTKWADGLVDYDAVTLASLINRANHYAVRPIAFGDPTLGDIRASGRFRVDDPERLQANLAHLFDLMVDTSDPNTVVLRRR